MTIVVPVQAAHALIRPANELALIALQPLGVTHVGALQVQVAAHVSCCTSPTLGHDPVTVIVVPGVHGVTSGPTSHPPPSTIVSAESAVSAGVASFVSAIASIVESVSESCASVTSVVVS
jgi:hypothetical protein